MITLSNLRTEPVGEWTRLECDFAWDGDVPNPFKEKTIWFAVKNENADFFSTKVYDPFLLVPYFVAMHYGQDLKICGRVSKKLYRNLTNYAYRILLDYSDELKPIHLEVDGFDQVEQDGRLIGASISCGVDSFTTLYDRFEKETDPEYRVNSVFFFNCGSYGSFYDERSYQGYLKRYRENKPAADELGLPMYLVESNIQFFQDEMGLNRIGHLNLWSCVLCLQRKVCKYYISSSNSYDETLKYNKEVWNEFLDAYSGGSIISLIQTERLELIYDGAQYMRTEKTEHIAEWKIAQKHLNVCFSTAPNCTVCPKCLRTLMTLEIIGKLNGFSQVFDLNVYSRLRFHNHCTQVALYKKDLFSRENVDFARARGMKLPPAWFAHLYYSAYVCAKAALKRVLSRETIEKIKGKLSGGGGNYSRYKTLPPIARFRLRFSAC